jgi:hypothetical protein
MKAEHPDFEAALIASFEKHKQKYDHEAGQRWTEWVSEFDKWGEEWMKARGVTYQELWQAVLEKLATMLPHYRQVPEFALGLKALDAAANGPVDEALRLAKWVWGLPVRQV